jgi:putative addiction module component (TIGR02574 family)
MTPTATRTGIPADLIERVNALTPEQREELFELTCLDDMPPDPRTEEELMAELKRRIEDAESGRVVGLTREEAKEQVRKILREQHGFEL